MTTGPPSGDVAITKVGSTPTVVAGGQVAYTLTVVNNGPSDAADVQVQDVIPAGGTVADVSPSRGTCTTIGGVVCSLGALPVGGTATITIVANYGPDTPLGSTPNTATISSPTADPTPGNNSSTAQLTVTGESNLSITKTGTPNPVVAGQPVVFTVTVSNSGPSRARGVVIQDQLPPEFVFVTAVPSQGTCGSPSAAGVVQCDIGELADEAQATVTITMNVPPGFPSGGAATNAAVVSSTTTDPDPGDNEATFTTSGATSADLSVTKTGAPTPVIAGQTVVWTVTVTNAGPSAAAGVTVVDDLPPGVTLVPPPGCTGTTQLTCAIGTIGAGASATVTITATVAPDLEGGSRLVNTAAATSSTPDPTTSNNTATSTTPVAQDADLSVTKLVTPDPAPAGSPIFFVITVTNNGPSTARNVTLVDTFDADASVLADLPDCQFLAGGELECGFGDLVSGASADLNFPVAIADDPGTYTNQVQVSSATPETNIVNNRAEVPVTALAPDVDLVLTKSGPTALLAGGRFEFTLTLANTGESIAFGATLTDTLPAGLIPDGAQGEGVRCGIAGQTVTCTADVVVPPIFAAPPLEITIVGAVTPGIVGATVTNTATASAAGETDPSNNSASTMATILRQSDVTIVKQADATEFVAGGTVGYTITVANAGPSAALDAIVTDILPDDVTFTPDLSDSRCGLVGPDVVCDLGTVPAGDVIVLRVAGRLDPNHSTASIVNTATFTSTSDDPNPGDNTSTTDTPVTFSADLQATKTATSESVTAGSNATFSLTITNQGPSTARSVALLDTIPPGTSLVSIETTPTLPCTGASCTIGDLQPGESVSAVVTVAVPPSQAAGPITNVVTASSPTPDPNPAAAHRRGHPPRWCSSPTSPSSRRS